MKTEATTWICDHCGNITTEYKDVLYWFRLTNERSEIIKDALNKTFHFCTLECLQSWTEDQITQIKSSVMA